MLLVKRARVLPTIVPTVSLERVRFWAPLFLPIFRALGRLAYRRVTVLLSTLKPTVGVQMVVLGFDFRILLGRIRPGGPALVPRTIPLQRELSERRFVKVPLRVIRQFMGAPVCLLLLPLFGPVGP